MSCYKPATYVLSLPLGQQKLLLNAIDGLKQRNGKSVEPTSGQNEDQRLQNTIDCQRTTLRTTSQTDVPVVRAPVDKVNSIEGTSLDKFSQLLNNLVGEQESIEGNTSCEQTRQDRGVNPGDFDPQTLLGLVGSLKGMGGINQDTVLTSLPSGAQLVLKQEATKVKFEKLTTTQWCAANCSLLKQIVTKLEGSEFILQYIEYMKRICELAEFYEWTSVLQYDKAFRMVQQQQPGRWDKDHPHLDRLYLRVARNQDVQRKQDRYQQASQHSQPCRLYNVGRCNYNPCRYPHVCIVPDCNQPHPQFLHTANLQPTVPKNGESPRPIGNGRWN